jgi:hypothetical protein
VEFISAGGADRAPMGRGSEKGNEIKEGTKVIDFRPLICIV